MDNTIKLAEACKIVTALAPVTPSSSTPRRISMKNYERCTIIINILNATTVTGSAITLLQATDIANANSDEKAVAFTQAWRNIDCAAGDTLTSFAVSSNTFTTDATNSKQLEYVIEVDSNDLDMANSFDCLRLGTANAVATTVAATYILRGARYKSATPPTAITN
jgi:hypothetical protein